MSEVGKIVGEFVRVIEGAGLTIDIVVGLQVLQIVVGGKESVTVTVRVAGGTVTV
jgi:hypothetical protein